MTLCLMCTMGMPSSCQDTSCDTQTEELSSPTDNTENTNEERTQDTTGSDFDTETSYQRYQPRTSTRHSSRRDNHLKDQQSTGRKRAARFYPLQRDSDCEWRSKANCGGGTSPILGCISGLQQARHHGPEKSVSNNSEGNVHRICHYCHNRWHTVNDPSYDWNDPNLNPHNPKPMTDAQRASAVIDEMRYLGTKQSKVKIED